MQMFLKMSETIIPENVNVQLTRDFYEKKNISHPIPLY